MGNYFKDLVNHPKRILKLSLVALVVLLIAGLAVLLFGGSQVMGIMLMAAGICCVVVALTVFWRCPFCDEFLPLNVATGRKGDVHRCKGSLTNSGRTRGRRAWSAA